MRFINIPHDIFFADASYSFDIFLYDKNSDSRIVSFYASTTIDAEREDKYLSMVRKGASFQILHDELDSFCSETQIPQKDIEDINKTLFDMIYLEIARKNKYLELSSENIHLKKFFSSDKNFNTLIKVTNAQILLFPLTISYEVTFTTHLVEKLFTQQIPVVFEAVLTFQFAKLLKVEDPEVLSSALLASMFKDLGTTQVPVDFDDINFYEKHPMLTILILSKFNFSFSNLTKRLILEHHEVYDGSGYPRNKQDTNIHFLTHAIRLSHELINLVKVGKYENTQYDWLDAFNIIISEREVEGFNNKFPPFIIDLIRSLKT